jgi:hypothetical protein
VTIGLITHRHNGEMLRVALWGVRTIGLAVVGLLTFRALPTVRGGPGTQVIAYALICVGVAVWGLVLQQYFVIDFLSSLVVAGFGAVLVASSPGGPGPGGGAGRDVGDQVCQETADLAECDRDKAAARTFGEFAAVTAR